MTLVLAKAGGGSSGGGGGNGIYGGSGALSGATVVSTGVNPLQFDSTGQVGLMYLDSVNDRVGIGTASPTARQHTVGNGNTSATYTAKFQNSDGTNLFTLRDDGAGVWNSTSGGTAYSFQGTGGSSIARFSRGGGPQILFDIDGSDYVYTNLITSNTARNVGITLNNSGDGALWSIANDSRDTANSLVIGTGAVSGSDNFNNAKLVLEQGGNVGVGETAPTARLHTKGDGNTSATYAVKIQNSDGTNLLDIRDDGYVTTGNNNVVVNRANNRVGINTATLGGSLNIGGDRVVVFQGGNGSINASSGALSLSALSSLSLASDNVRVGGDVGGGKFNVIGTDNSLPITAIRRNSATSSKKAISVRDESGIEQIAMTTDGGFQSTEATNGIKRFVFEELMTPSGADGDGVGLNFKAENKSGVLKQIGNLDFVYDDLNASEVSCRLSTGVDTLTEKLRITHAGNFGFLTTTPITTLDVVGGNARSIVTKTADYTATVNDSTILTDATSGDITITLPTAASAYNSTDGTGLILNISHDPDDVSGNSTIIDGNGSETVAGELTQVISAGEVINLQSTGTKWILIN